MSKFELYIYKDTDKYKSQLKIPSLERFSIPFLGITNSFLQSMPLDIDEVEANIGNILKAMLSKILSISFKNEKEMLLKHEILFSNLSDKPHFENPVLYALPFGDKSLNFTPGICFLTENLCIRQALNFWLKPSGKGRVYRKERMKPSEKYAEFFSNDYSLLDLTDMRIFELGKNYIKNENYIEHMKLLLIDIFNTRTNQFGTKFVHVEITKDKIPNQYGTHIREKAIAARLYTSTKGILPLIWAELMYAVENDVFLKRCEVCSKWYPIPKGKYEKKTCSTQCAAIAKRDDSKLRRSEANAKEKR